MSEMQEPAPDTKFQSTPSARRATGPNFCISAIRSVFQSTPSARRATCSAGQSAHRMPISIHALREEGDLSGLRVSVSSTEFQSTPSARRATLRSVRQDVRNDISIHALGEEGDDASPARLIDLLGISIHALREEGDLVSCCTRRGVMSFQSTPSARRATISCKGG